jgi:hypothetical protein
MTVAALPGQDPSAPKPDRNRRHDATGLLEKLDEASAQLDAGRPADAVQTLEDFTANVYDLAAAGRLSADDAGALIAAADDAIERIGALDPGWPA